jgi:cyclopropane-fatty-acyl-phospholipid synthase
MSQSSPDGVLARTISILDRLFPPPRRFTVRLWDGTELPGSGDSGFCPVFNHPGALRRMLTPPVELSLGEAFIYGDIDIDGDIFAATSLVDDLLGRRFTAGDMVALARGLRSLPRAGSEHVAGRGAAHLHGSRHSPARDQAAIQYHYDVGNDFYALWLDRAMQYSCAYFHSGTEDLDTAQEQKMEHICRKLRLRPGERLLDIGCGWGGLTMYAAEACGVQALGITLSQNQVDYANDQIGRAGLGDRVQVELMSAWACLSMLVAAIYRNTSPRRTGCSSPAACSSITGFRCVHPSGTLSAQTPRMGHRFGHAAGPSGTN